jgi:hypothetical protein
VRQCNGQSYGALAAGPTLRDSISIGPPSAAPSIPAQVTGGTSPYREMMLSGYRFSEYE